MLFPEDSADREKILFSWANTREDLRKQLGEQVFHNWIQPLVLKTYEQDRVVLGAPSLFIKDWVTTYYFESLQKIFNEKAPYPVTLALEVLEGQTLESSRPLSDGTKISGSSSIKDDSSLEEGDERLLMGSPLDSRSTFENFVVGKPNELAHAAARRVAEAETVPFNPLFLYGGVGLGKTHLMHAIAHHIQSTHPKRKVMYLSAEKFMYQFIKALRFRNTVAFKERFRSVDVLMIDDVQFISGKDSTQEEFFHTFNALVDQNRQVVISADKSPSDLEGMEERMRSRLGWGLVADIHPTTYELRLGILQTKAEQFACAIPLKILDFLAHKITSNVRELEGALTRVVAHTTLVGRQMTLEMVQEVLRDLLRSYDRILTVEDVQRRVAEYYRIRLADLHSAKRTKDIALPRQVAMFLAKQLTSKSLPEIGRQFGGRDHTTILHGVRKIEEMIRQSSALAEDIDILRKTLQN
jgi:chromosomal replication initiator protein